MGRYMTVVLKEEFNNDLFILTLNQELINTFGANTWHKFNPWYCLEEEASYMNNHPDGIKQLQHWERPVTANRLSENFFWLKNGEFHFKLSGGTTSDEARDAIAVAKWIECTKSKFINKTASSDYDKKTVGQYLNEVMAENGYDVNALWTSK